MNPVFIRYIRIYGLSNSANRWFHVVEVEAYDEHPNDPKGYIGKKVDLPGETGVVSAESYTPKPISYDEIIKTIEDIEEKGVLNPELIKRIKYSFENIIVIEQNIKAVRSEIVNPVTEEIESANKLAKRAMKITIGGAIVSVIGLIFSIITSSTGIRIGQWFVSFFNANSK